MSFKSGFESRERESQFNTAGGSEFQVRQCWTIVWQMMSVEMARTAVGRTTIYLCMHSFHFQSEL